MANLEVLALDTAVPQIRAPGAGDGYSVPRDMTLASGTTLTAPTVNATTVDATNVEVTNIKAKDGTAAATIADSTGKITVSTELAVDNLNLSGNAITSTDTNGNIDLTPNGTGEVNITKVDIDSGAIDGTAIGANSASTGAFSTLSASGNVTLSGGTANGVLYLNGSKVATSGSALTFNGSDLTVANGDITIATNGKKLYTNYIATNSGVNLNFDSSNFLFNTGNVGIGTTSPSRKLDVYGVIQAADASGIQSVLWPQAATGVGGVGTNNNYPFAILTNGTERARITAAGELLVGGTTAISSASGAVTIQRTGNATLNFFRDDTTVVSGEALGVINFYGNDTTSNTPTQLARIIAEASGTHAAGDNPTDISFHTTPDGTETVAEAGRITQAGSYVLKGGTTSIAAGVGIIFPATQVASANANSLDDYEEGTWTPTLAGVSSGSGQTYTTQSGKYVKIGDLVVLTFVVTLSAKGTMSGLPVIGGIPFVASAHTTDNSGLGLRWGNLNISPYNVGYIARGGNFAQFYLLKVVTAGTVEYFATGSTDFTDTSEIAGTISYRVTA